MKILGVMPLGELGAEGADRPAGSAEPPGGRLPRPRRRASALADLLARSAALAWRAARLSEAVQRSEGVTGKAREVLHDLATHGPRTVPALARARSVTRQGVQGLVNGLVEAGYVELRENPAHKRSRLVELTAGGSELVERMKRREREVLGRLKLNVDERAMRRAAALLEEVGSALEQGRDR